MQYRSLCCDSESMFNLVVYSSTHSLVGGTSDAIIQGRATVTRSFLFHCSSSTTLFSQKYKLCQLYASLPEANPLCALAHAKARIPQSSSFSSRFSGNLQHQPRAGPTSPRTFQEQLRQEPLSHCVSRKFRPNVCMNGRRRRATPRRRSSHFGQSIFCWYEFHRHH